MFKFRAVKLNATKVCFLAAPLLLAACASQPEATVASAEEQSDEPTIERSTVAPVAERTASEVDPLLSELVIHFDFDESSVAQDYQALLAAHGQYLAEHSDVSLRLEGHADERGTREYNVGLGERRASSVRQMLMLQGARTDQIEILSYGEEMPVVDGSDERSWQQNRRVELNYLSN